MPITLFTEPNLTSPNSFPNKEASESCFCSTKGCKHYGKVRNNAWCKENPFSRRTLQSVIQLKRTWTGQIQDKCNVWEPINTHTLTAQVHQHRWQRPPPPPASHNIYTVCSLVGLSPAHTLGRSTGSPPPCSSAPTATRKHTITHTHSHSINIF